MAILEAVQSQLDRWGPKVADSALAALALGLASQLDDPDLPGTAYAQMAGRLHLILVDLDKAAPAKTETDTIQSIRDELAARRSS